MAVLAAVPVVLPVVLTSFSTPAAATIAAPTGCPSTVVNAPSTATWTVGGSNTTYDASAPTYYLTSTSLTPVKVNGSTDCLANVHVQGTVSRTVNWWQLKQCCNGAGITVNSPTTLVNPRADNVTVDGIRIWNKAATVIRGAYFTYTRDDCISDTTHAALTVDDSLFDGCHTGISWRNGTSTAFPVKVTNSMFYVQPQPGSTSGGSCTQWVVNGLANGPMWKMDGFTGPVDVENTIIRQDLGNHECVDKWPSGTYKNVTFVWTNSKAYPGQLPPGVVMTRDVTVWKNARAGWLQAHGYPTA